MRDTDVLIVGAGPTGLVLALWLARRGVAFRIVDKAAEPGTTSRALAVHARTLEFYRQLGIADEFLELGIKLEAVNMWVRGKRAGRVAFGNIGGSLSPYPYLCIVPQDVHERFLIDQLRRCGVEVERSVELAAFEDRGDAIVATLHHAGVAEHATIRYLAGCDGARSTVREQIGAGFPGGTYERIFYVADVVMQRTESHGELDVALDDADFLAIFPMKGDRAARLIGTIRAESEEHASTLTWYDVSQRAIDEMRISVGRINWFSTYRVHHRVARTFRRGRAFLLGDAAHIHSPVGGQGMNTGIGDAVNLAWKLADVLKGETRDVVLDSYEPERIAFANRLVATTDRAFTFTTRDGALARFVRLGLVPLLLPIVSRLRAVQRLMFLTVSQTRIKYRKSALSRGAAGTVRGGDRLPWVPRATDSGDNFVPLASLDWQLHVYGDAPPSLRSQCERLGLPLHQFSWRTTMRVAGIVRDAAYLVRPDGYVAFAGVTAEQLGEYVGALRRAASPAPPPLGAQ